MPVSKRFSRRWASVFRRSDDVDRSPLPHKVTNPLPPRQIRENLARPAEEDPTDEEKRQCAVDIDPEGLERELLAELDAAGASGMTIVAYALTAETRLSGGT